MGRKKQIFNRRKTVTAKVTNKSASTNGGNHSNEINHSQEEKMMDIFARLNFPLQVSSGNLSVDGDGDDDDDEVLEFEMRPRFFYVSSLCLVCMEISSKVCCDQCKIIFYCSEKHKMENKEKHIALCEALTEICQGMEGFSLAKGLSPHSYRSFRIKTIMLIESKLKRQLDLWEKEIILYPRICRFCKRVDENLICCPICGIDFYCEAHKANHDVWCKEFQVFRRILCLQYKYGFITPDIPNIQYKESKIIPDNMDIFLYSLYRENNSKYKLIDSYTYASLSYLATAPLTALFAIQKTIADWSTRQSINIYIIGAEFQFECSCLKIWEKFFLHFLPNIKVLSLKFIGPELYLPPVPVELMAKIPICKLCKSNKKIINTSFHPQTLYHNIKDNLLLPPCDLICLFNPGLYRETGFDGADTWPETIVKFCSAKVPIVVTAYTDFEIPRDIERIKSICNISILLEPQRNPFGSLKPDRNFVSDDVVPFMYKNHCISIVKGV